MFGEAALCQDNTRESLEEDLYFLPAAATTVWEKHWAGFCGFPLFRAPHHFNHKITASLQKGKEILANLHFLFFF